MRLGFLRPARIAAPRKPGRPAGLIFKGSISGLRVRHFVAGWTLLLQMLSESVMAAEPDAPNQPLRIVAFGDSTTATAVD